MNCALWLGRRFIRQLSCTNYLQLFRTCHLSRHQNSKQFFFSFCVQVHLLQCTFKGGEQSTSGRNSRNYTGNSFSNCTNYMQVQVANPNFGFRLSALRLKRRLGTIHSQLALTAAAALAALGALTAVCFNQAQSGVQEVATGRATVEECIEVVFNRPMINCWAASKK